MEVIKTFRDAGYRRFVLAKLECHSTLFVISYGQYYQPRILQRYVLGVESVSDLTNLRILDRSKNEMTILMKAGNDLIISVVFDSLKKDLIRNEKNHSHYCSINSIEDSQIYLQNNYQQICEIPCEFTAYNKYTRPSLALIAICCSQFLELGLYDFES